MNVYWSPLYRDAISPEARFPRERYQRVRDEVSRRDADKKLTVCSPRPATREELCVAHDPNYIDAFLDNRLERREILRIGFRPWLPAFQERTLRLAGASIQALEDVADGAPIAGNLGGGTHHAFAAHGEGYCVFNDLAVVAQLARREYGIGQIVIIDLDVHQGNGTAHILSDEPEIFTYSIHGAKNYPFRKQESDLDVEVPSGAVDTEYLSLLDASLPEVIERRRPELVLFQAGVDPLATDALGKLALTREGIRERNRRVFEWSRAVDARMIVFMGGGYSDPIDASVDSHVDTFLEAAVFGG